MSEFTFRLLWAGAMWAWALYSLVSGKLVMRGVYRRDESPVTYWLGISFLVALGVVLMVAGPMGHGRH